MRQLNVLRETIVKRGCTKSNCFAIKGFKFVEMYGTIFSEIVQSGLES